MRRLLPAKRRIFYRNVDKAKAIRLLAFLLSLIVIQSTIIGYLFTTVSTMTREEKHEVHRSSDNR